MSPSTSQHPAVLQVGCPSCRPTKSVKALKGNVYCYIVIRNGAAGFVEIECVVTFDFDQSSRAVSDDDITVRSVK